VKLWDKFKAALLAPANLIACGLLIAAGIIFPRYFIDMLVVVLVGEAIYLATVPNLPIFQLYLERERAKKRRKELLSSISPADKGRYFKLEALYDGLRDKFKSIPPEERSIHLSLMEDALNRSQAILDAFLVKLSNLNTLREYDRAGRREEVEREIESMQSEMDNLKSKGGSDDRLLKTKEKRLNTLRRRLGYFAKAHERSESLKAELAQLEDALTLLRDEFEIRSHEAVLEGAGGGTEALGTVDDILSTIDLNEKILKDLEDITYDRRPDDERPERGRSHEKA
jgi:hypothetical protein